jgi:hypothetical protein
MSMDNNPESAAGQASALATMTRRHVASNGINSFYGHNSMKNSSIWASIT